MEQDPLSSRSNSAPNSARKHAPDPAPTVHWFKGERELTYSNRHRVEHDPLSSRYGLAVASLLQTDHGIYSVRAENEAGTCESACLVNVHLDDNEDGGSKGIKGGAWDEAWVRLG